MTHRAPAAVVCCPGSCPRKATLPGGGWACRTALEAGRLERSASPPDAPSASHGDACGPKPAFASGSPASRARGLPAARDSHSCASPAQAARVAAIEAGRCPCCEGSLGGSEWPTWRRCVDCGCHWKVARIGGLNYSERFVNPRCEARAAAGVAARRTA